MDRTSHSLDKLPIYAHLSIPQVWRYVVGGRPEIFALGETGEGYFPTAESRVLGPITGDELARFIEAGRTSEPTIWAHEVRPWARSNPAGGRSRPAST